MDLTFEIFIETVPVPMLVTSRVLPDIQLPDIIRPDMLFAGYPDPVFLCRIIRPDIWYLAVLDYPAITYSSTEFSYFSPCVVSSYFNEFSLYEYLIKE